jgi:hypothetical protein
MALFVELAVVLQCHRQVEPTIRGTQFYVPGAVDGFQNP